MIRDLHDHRHQHVPVGRPRQGRQGDGPSGEEPPGQRELIGNVSLKVLPTQRPDAWEVQGRGELALAILVERCAAKGFRSLPVSRGGHQDHRRQGVRATSCMTIDAPDEFLGAITQLMAGRKGLHGGMVNHTAPVGCAWNSMFRREG